MIKSRHVDSDRGIESVFGYHIVRWAQIWLGSGVIKIKIEWNLNYDHIKFGSDFSDHYSLVSIICETSKNSNYKILYFLTLNNLLLEIIVIIYLCYLFT